MRDEPIVVLKRQNSRSCRTQKRCAKVKTAGRWPWKSEIAKDRVTTHLPNSRALKMDGAQTGCLYTTANENEYSFASRAAWS